MYKKFFLIILSFTLLISCNNNKDDDDQSAFPGQEEQMKDLIAQYPDSSLLRENMIQYYRDNDNYDEALSAVQEAINKDSSNPRFRDIQATLYFENDDTIHAIQSLQKAIAIYPDPQYMMSLGSIYAQTKNPLALAMADLLIKDPKSQAQKESLFIKGLYYSSTGDNTKAIDYFNQALAIDYTFTFAYREKAICLYNMEKYKEAIDVLTKAVEVVNTYDEGYYWMGRCYEKLGDKDQAIKCYQLALKIDKNYTEAKDALTKLGVDE